MPAGLPGESQANNLANPALGRPIIFDPLSGPKGSPFDKDPVGKASTGALNTGIGFGLNTVIGQGSFSGPSAAIFASGFNDNSVPGNKIVTYAPAPPPGVVTATTVDATRLYIGGGRSVANAVVPDKNSIPFVASPYTTGVALAAAGNGASRDAGAGPAFTAFPMRMVTATGAVANGNAVEAGFLNRSGIPLVATQSVFGSDAAAMVAPTVAADDPSQKDLELEFDKGLKQELAKKKEADADEARQEEDDEQKHGNGGKHRKHKHDD